MSTPAPRSFLERHFWDFMEAFDMTPEHPDARARATVYAFTNDLDRTLEDDLWARWVVSFTTVPLA